MGWETRRGGRYYYRKRRVAGDDGVTRVVSTYLGNGPVADLAAEQDALARAKAAYDRDAERALAEALAAADAALEEFDEAAGALAHAVLASLGYRKRRGEWRRCRHAVLDDPAVAPNPGATPDPGATPIITDPDLP